MLAPRGELMNVKSKIVIVLIGFMVIIAAKGQVINQNEASLQGSLSSLANFTPPSVTQPVDYASEQNADPGLMVFTAEQRLNFAKDMSLYILAFGLIITLFAGIIAIYTKGWNREATNVFTVTIIVTAGLFLMTAGYSSQQIAPMYGLLGTIVGYLLGKTRPSEEEVKSDQKVS